MLFLDVIPYFSIHIDSVNNQMIGKRRRYLRVESRTLASAISIERRISVRSRDTKSMPKIAIALDPGRDRYRLASLALRDCDSPCPTHGESTD